MSFSRFLLHHFQGCLLGLAGGDGLGGRFEGQSPDGISGRFPSPEVLIAAPPFDVLHYTDDTQMAIAVAEALVESREIREERLHAAFQMRRAAAGVG